MIPKKLELLFIFSLLLQLTTKAQEKVEFPNTKDDGSIGFPAKEMDEYVSFSRYNAVVFGEAHTILFEPDFKFQLIRYLNDQHGFRDVFLEIGHSTAYTFNQFLEKGDSSLLSLTSITYTLKNGNYMRFWRNLYAYNQSLPEDKKIRIHGVDFERVVVFKVLLLLKPNNKTIPQSLQTAFSLIDQGAKDTSYSHFSKKFVHQLEKVCSIFKKNLSDVQSYYALNSSIVMRIINNKSPHTSKVLKRNKAFLESMKETIASYQIKKFFASFGGAHTSFQKPTSLTNTINTIEGYNGRVLHIDALYFNAYSVFTKGYLDYIGLIKGKNKDFLYNKYLTKSCRATLYKSNTIEDKFLSKSSDYTLFVNDTLHH